MAWMRVARIRVINHLLEEIGARGRMTRDEALKYIMNLEMLSKITAERYLYELTYQGRIIEEKGVIKLAGEKK